MHSDQPHVKSLFFLEQGAQNTASRFTRLGPWNPLNLHHQDFSQAVRKNRGCGPLDLIQARRPIEDHGDAQLFHSIGPGDAGHAEILG